MRLMQALGLAALILGCGSRSFAGPPLAAAPVVVELFTSQGCSSCPPADALLGVLAGQPNVIALGFHVDYWDDGGWRDRYSMPEATQRQRRYVDALRLASAFTPQLVIGGSRSFVGSDGRGIAPVITAALAQASPGIAIETSVAGGELLVSLPDGGDGRNYDVNLVAYIPQATTAIGRGENSGRTLTDFNIVRQIRRLGAWTGKAATFHVALAALPADANHAAVLVQRVNLGPMAGALTIRLR
jgi:hypothetical protein